VTELKVDRSFVMTMNEDPSDALIVHSVVDLGHNLGLTIVAEGVETPGALSRLAAFGCDVAQGYHWSRPVPIEEFDAWREEHTRQTAATEARDRAKLAPI
jgi:EAL domain-containing protein (putative c-di-GMP-specific phosphodiesterase class I)